MHKDQKKAQDALMEWLEEHNPGGFDFTMPPPREMISEAFPDEDDERLDYLTRKPSRIYELY